MVQPRTPRIVMVAGETSGDMLAAPFMEAIRARWPQALCVGIGGVQMRQQGFETWWDLDELDVQGVAVILREYPRLWRLRRDLVQRVLDFAPDVFIGVDAPEFNLGVERRLHARGVKTMHYISPSVWAWRASRLQNIQRDVDHMLCLYPFEPGLYAQVGVAATFVGHPLASSLQPVWDSGSAKTALGLDTSRPVLAVLPGSRSSEVQTLGPRFMQACHLLLKQKPELQIVLPAVTQRLDLVRALTAAHGLDQRIQVLTEQAHAALAACDVALIASGTATLEAMLIARPMVIAYAMPALSFYIIKWMSTTKWVGLPNILSQRLVVPEFLQNAATPPALSQAVLDWMQQPEKAAHLKQHFTQLQRDLQRNSAALCVQALAQVLDVHLAPTPRMKRPVHAANIIGVDEAGRGPLCGPVVAAAVLLPDTHSMVGLRDSKKLSAVKREQLAVQIRAQALGFAIGEASVAEIDSLNILQATLLAMQRAVLALPISAIEQAEAVWVDGNRCPDLGPVHAHLQPSRILACRALVGGDDSVSAIAAASILAKTHRDALCLEADATWPGYGFAQHKGYGTVAHLAALRRHGPCSWHRHGFAPVRALLEGHHA